MSLKKLSPQIVKDKNIIVRVDFNVPLADGKVAEQTRIITAIPTLNFLLENGAKTVQIISHLGRPKGAIDPQFSLKKDYFWYN